MECTFSGGKMKLYKLLLVCKRIILYVIIPAVIVGIAFSSEDGYKFSIVMGLLYILCLLNLNFHNIDEKVYSLQREYLINKSIQNCTLYEKISTGIEGMNYELLQKGTRLSCLKNRFRSDNCVCANYKDVPFQMSHIRGWELERLERNLGFVIPAFKGFLCICPNSNHLPEMVYDSHKGKIGIIINGIEKTQKYSDRVPAKTVVWTTSEDVDIRIDGMVELCDSINRHTLIFINKNYISIYVSDHKNSLRGALLINENKMDTNRILDDLKIPALFIDAIVI